MRIRLASAILGLLTFAQGLPLQALETDQYLAWGEELADSTDRVNEYLNREIEEVLSRINGRRGGRPIACERVPFRVYRHLFPSLLSSKLRRFLLTDSQVDRFPDREVGYFAYLNRSIYRKPAFPFFLPLGRTVRINEVNVGIDKLGGHMFGFGRRYYKRYLRELRGGASEREAMERAILWGLEVERFFVGGLVDGVVSFADLEANYQGMILARSFCHGPDPHLALEGDRWVLARPVDLRDHVGPKFDESYNSSRYHSYRWRQVKPVLKAEHCPRFASPEVQELMTSYRRRDRPSLSQQLIEGYFAAHGDKPADVHSLANICADAPRSTSMPGSAE